MASESWTINFRGSVWDCRARMLWQTLFDVYRANGGNLARMDNLLIDLRNCVEVMDGLNGKAARVLWGFYPAAGMTTWIPEASWFSGDPKLTADISSCERFVLVDVSEDEAVFTPLTGKE